MLISACFFYFQARSNAQIVFNLSMYRDFRILLPNDKLNESEHDNEGNFYVSIMGQETIDAVLQFTPTEVCLVYLVFGLFNCFRLCAFTISILFFIV